MRFITIVSTSLLAVFVGFAPVYAQQLSEEDRYKLCTDSPSNPQCKGYEAPVALDDRPGEAGACVMVANKVESKTVCKLVVSEKTVIAYYEVGEKLGFFNQRKVTRAIQLNPTDIKAIQYQEGSKDNSTGRVINTLLFGLGGLFTANKAVSEVAIDYIISAPVEFTARTAETDSKLPNTSAKTPNIPTIANAVANLDRIKVVVRRKTGKELRLQLEQLTGIKAEVPAPPAKEPEPEPSEVDS